MALANKFAVKSNAEYTSEGEIQFHLCAPVFHREQPRALQNDTARIRHMGRCLSSDGRTHDLWPAAAHGHILRRDVGPHGCLKSPRREYIRCPINPT